jgi:uncharacterized membrane protein
MKNLTILPVFNFFHITAMFPHHNMAHPQVAGGAGVTYFLSFIFVGYLMMLPVSQLYSIRW